MSQPISDLTNPIYRSSDLLHFKTTLPSLTKKPRIRKCHLHTSPLRGCFHSSFFQTCLTLPSSSDSLPRKLATYFPFSKWNHLPGSPSSLKFSNSYSVLIIQGLGKPVANISVISQCMFLIPLMEMRHQCWLVDRTLNWGFYSHLCYFWS